MSEIKLVLYLLHLTVYSMKALTGKVTRQQICLLSIQVLCPTIKKTSRRHFRLRKTWKQNGRQYAENTEECLWQHATMCPPFVYLFGLVDNRLHILKLECSLLYFYISAFMYSAERSGFAKLVLCHKNLAASWKVPFFFYFLFPTVSRSQS